MKVLLRFSLLWLLPALCYAQADLPHEQHQQSPDKFYAFFEAEGGSKNDSLQKQKDPQASGGQYIWAPTGVASFDFQVPRDGAYRVWGRVIAADGHADSFLVSMDGEMPFVQWNGIKRSAAWLWDDIHNSRKNGETVIYQLTAGKHTLRFKSRSDDNSCKIDRLLITNDLAYTPATNSSTKDDPTTTAQGSVFVSVEAEDGKVELPFQVASDASASGGEYVWTPDADASYEFTVTKPGTYKVWAKTLAPGGSGSIFVRMDDDSRWARWVFQKAASWHWSYSTKYEGTPRDDETLTFELAPGKHVLRLMQHKEGTKIDCLLITDDLNYVPADTYPRK